MKFERVAGRSYQLMKGKSHTTEQKIRILREVDGGEIIVHQPKPKTDTPPSLVFGDSLTSIPLFLCGAGTGIGNAGGGLFGAPLVPLRLQLLHFCGLGGGEVF